MIFIGSFQLEIFYDLRLGKIRTHFEMKNRLKQLQISTPSAGCVKKTLSIIQHSLVKSLMYTCIIFIVESVSWLSIARIIHRSLICSSLKPVAHTASEMSVISLSRHWIVSIHEHKDHISFFCNFETCWDIGTSECYLLNALLFHMNHFKGRLYTATWSPLYVVYICGGLDIVCAQKWHLKGQKRLYRFKSVNVHG